ncbi:MAG: PsbP-related protein [Halothermotrichaceae bacterium]
MKKRLFFSLLTLLLLLSISTYAQNDFESYQNDKYGFRIDYPGNWELKEDSFDSVISIISEREDENDNVSENINVVVQDLSTQPMSLKEYTELSIDQINNVIENGEVLENEFITFAENEGVKIIYKGELEDLKLKWLVKYLIKNNKAYLVTYTAAEDKFDKYLPTVEKMYDSFQLIK